MPSSITNDTPRQSAVLLDEVGNPVDRTVCPDCRNHAVYRSACATCDGTGTVCPTCRGAHWVTLRRPDYGVPAHGPCPHCLKPTMRDGEQVHDGDKRRKRFERNIDGEVDAILWYRARGPQTFQPPVPIGVPIHAGSTSDDDIPF